MNSGLVMAGFLRCARWSGRFGRNLATGGPQSRSRPGQARQKVRRGEPPPPLLRPPPPSGGGGGRGRSFPPPPPLRGPPPLTGEEIGRRFFLLPHRGRGTTEWWRGLGPGGVHRHKGW